MRPRYRQRAFAWVRQHPVSRLAAYFLLLLILVPFTAPFRTIDLVSAPVGHSSDGLPKDKADADSSVSRLALAWALPTPPRTNDFAVPNHPRAALQLALRAVVLRI